MFLNVDILMQISSAKREAMSASLKLEQEQHDLVRKQTQSQVEIEKVRSTLEQRLRELEPLPEMLRNSEQKLLEATERLLNQEHKTADHTKAFTEMTLKVRRTR